MPLGPATTSQVSNLGKANHQCSIQPQRLSDVAQGFTTGSNAGGYVLDAVVLNFASPRRRG